MKKGFTLIEIMFAVIVIGIAFVSLMAANIAYTQNNSAGAKMSTSETLLQQAREFTVKLDYDQLLALDLVQYNPPRDVTGNSLNDFDEYTQKFIVQNVSSSDFTNVVSDGASDFIKVTVEIYKDSNLINSSSWIRAKLED